MFRFAAALAIVLTAASAFAQTSTNPFTTPIEATAGVISMNFTEFAVIPDAAGGEAPRMMHLVDESGTKRLFVSTMRGGLYGVSYDGKTVTEYLDINAPGWNIGVQFAGQRTRLPELRVPSRSSTSAARAATASSTPTSTRPT